MEYKRISEVVNVYSKDRDITLFPSPSNYSISFLNTVGKTFKNVESVRLLSAVFPDVNNVSQQPFLVLQIEELENSGMFGSNSILNNGSFLVQLDRPVSIGFFLNTKTDICKSIINAYSTPLRELSKMTIKITDESGNLFNFGTDTGSPSVGIQHLLSFEIVRLEPVSKLTTLH